MKINHFPSTVWQINLLPYAFVYAFFAMFMIQNTQAQTSGRKVESAVYDITLQGLLSHTVDEVSVYQLENLKNYQLLDSREWREYQVSHIPGATWVGYDDFQLERVKDLDKNRPVLVYCSVGYRSEKIGEKLKEAGFSDVKNLYGGMFEWMNAGNLPVDSQGHSTEKIHAYDRVWGVWIKKGKKVYK